jgi:hypothetical protein
VSELIGSMRVFKKLGVRLSSVDDLVLSTEKGFVISTLFPQSINLSGFKMYIPLTSLSVNRLASMPINLTWGGSLNKKGMSDKSVKITKGEIVLWDSTIQGDTR